MASADVAGRVLEELERAAEQHGIDIVDVEITGASKAPVLRIRLDWLDEDAGPITLDEVADQNDWISAVVDELDPFAGAYALEVSSPGLARPLRRERDFVRYAGEEVSLTTTASEGRRKFSGTLEGFEKGCVVMTCDGEVVRIPLDEVRRCKINPKIDFNRKQ